MTKEFKILEIEMMLVQNIINAAPTGLAAQIVFATETHKALRFCVDHRELNAVTKRDFWPMLRMERNIDTLKEEPFFSTLHAKSCFWQIKTDKLNPDKVAFTSRHGIYRFISMHFGL